MDRITDGMLEEFANSFDLGSLAGSELFEQFVCYAVVKRHYSETFDPGDLTTGKAVGIDGIAVLINGTLISDIDAFHDLVEKSGTLEVQFIFIQAKSSDRFDSAQLSNFAHAVLDFFRSEPTLPRTPKVTESATLMEEIYKRSSKFRGGNNPSCRLYYVTTGKLVPDAVLESRRQQAMADISDLNLFGTVDCALVGADALHKLYRQARNAISRDFVFEKKSVLPVVPGVDQSYLGLIPATELIKILTGDEGEMAEGLFYANVRDWEGYNKINDSIRQTLKSPERSRFVLMNNGITITARSLQAVGDRFHIEDFQVVNGCQTCHVLFDHRAMLDESVLIPLRLIATQDEELINSITKATNRQTHVKDEQFFALTEFPKQLERFFETYPEPHRLYYERRPHQYDRRQIEKTRIVTQASMVRAFAAMFLEEPHGATKGRKSLTERLGTEICGKDHRSEPYYVALFTQYKLDYLFRNKKLDAKYKPARYHILLATRLLGNSESMPPMNSRQMEKYCTVITDALWDAARAERLLFSAVEAVNAVALNNFHRDNIRTASFTKKLLEHCLGTTRSNGEISG